MVMSANQSATQYLWSSTLTKTQHNNYGHVHKTKLSTIPLVMSTNQNASQYLWSYPLTKTQHNTYGHVP